MSINKATKEKIKAHLLERIDRQESSVVASTAAAFGVTPATVYKYLDQMIAEERIVKKKRGEYELAAQGKGFAIDLIQSVTVTEDSLFDEYIRPAIAELPRNVQSLWQHICGEIIGNMLDHAGARHCRIILQQNAVNTTVILADDGIGIFSKIKNYFGYDSLDDAVGELFKGKITTDRANHSGEGIFFASQMADSFVIFSSNRIFSREPIAEDQRSLFAGLQGAGDSRGTIVIMTLNNHSEKTPKAIYEQYASETGEFIRTVLPIRQYFDRDPVSRSQAKRLCYRLDEFKIVELDFEGVEWMGQGFAHQLFAVFCREHPEVRLIPVHANEDIMKMIVHVGKGM